jgi:tetratricopeptide (TPR) repeat protein
LDPTGTEKRTHRVRMALSCLAVLLLSSLIGAAQSPTVQPPPADNRNDQVSARELRIPRKARDAFNKGTQLLAAKESAASIPEFRHAIKIFPEFYEAYYKIGLAGLNLRQYREAQTAFETSIELSKGRYPPSQFGLGLALCMQKQFEAAEEAIRAGLDQYPADAAGNFTLAWVLFSAGRWPEAEKSTRQAILSNANLASAYLLLAQIHLRQSDLTALVSDLDAYLRLDPNGEHNAQAKAIRAEAEQLLAKQPSNAPAVAKIPAP